VYPNASGEVIVADQQLSQSSMEIPTKKSVQSKVQPTNDVSMKTIELQEGDSTQNT